MPPYWYNKALPTPTLHVRTSALCCFWWEKSAESRIHLGSASTEQNSCFSDVFSERLLLAIVLISSTESCVIGYA